MLSFIHLGYTSSMTFAQTSAASISPQILKLEEGWRVHPDDGEPLFSPDLDDSGWSTTRVPHFRQEASAELTASRRSIWFRRRFSAPALPPGWRALLEVADASAVGAWINGREAASTGPESKYLCRDITDLVRAGENAIAVRTETPGISKGLFIHLAPPVRLDPSRLLVDTPGFSGGAATIRVRHLATNTSGAAARCKLAARAFGPDGKEIARGESKPREIAAGSSAPFEVELSPIADPPVWSIETPNICRLEAELEVEGGVGPQDETRFGIRWFEFKEDGRFFLNGRHVKLHGTVYINLPKRDYPNRRAFWDYEIGQLKEMGLNFIRQAEGADETTIEECDRVGMLVVCHVHDVGTAESFEETLPGPVRTKYNSPSIIAWSFNGEGKDANRAALQSAAARVLRKTDPGRPVCCVELGWRAQGAIGLTDCDIAGQGNYTGWYEGTLEHIGPYMDDYRQLLIERYGKPLPMIVSNYGAAADPTVHADKPRRNDYSIEYHAEFHKRFVKEIESREWLAGGLIFSFRDIDGGQGIPRHTWKGVVDRHEHRRDAYYYYKSAWTQEPTAHIAGRDWNPREVWPTGASRKYEVYSNCDAVELFLNGRSLGKRTKAQAFVWDAPVVEGANELRAIAEKAGKKVEDSATVEVRFNPPVLEPRLTPGMGAAGKPGATLAWDKVDGVEEVAIHTGDSLDFEPAASNLAASSRSETFEITELKTGAFYRVIAKGKGRSGPASVAVGWGDGALRWRFANEGWLRSAPSLADLDGDGKKEVVFGSYDGCVYALRSDGSLIWKHKPPIVECVIGAVCVATLAPGESPSVIVSSSKAIYVLRHDGALRWRNEGHRTYDRSTKSPAAADIDGDGRLEILAPSDTGEFAAFDLAGKRLWQFTTKQPGHRGLAQTTPVAVDAPGGPRIVFSADDGGTYCLDGKGQLLWRHDNQIGGSLPGTPPTQLTPCAAALKEGGPIRILLGARGLKALDLDGKVVKEIPGLNGSPVVADLFKDGKRQFIVAAGRELRVFDTEGNPLWAFPFEGRGNFITSSVVAADADGDGKCELLVGARDTHLYAIGADGKLKWRFKTVDEVSGAPSVGDIDGDGLVEILSPARDGYLRCIGGGEKPKGALEVLQYRGGPRRSGDYSGQGG